MEELFNDSNFALPYIESDDKKSFLHHFGERMNAYQSELSSLPDAAYSSFDKQILLKQVESIIKRLESVLRFYLNGFPAQAYLSFKELAEIPYLNSHLTNLRTISLPTNTPLFRTKKDYQYKQRNVGTSANGFIGKLEPMDLFHVPFEMRKAIGTNRFSIPGFPCIYLSGTLHTSWAEAIDDETQSFHAISYRNHRPVYIVDLVPINLAIPASGTASYLGTMYSYNDDNDAYLDYASLYPLITACHSKVSYTEAYFGEVKFKSEYIIPQLLLQWYRDNNVIVDGVRYLSCTANARFPTSVFDKFNYVIPALEVEEVGYCSSLTKNYSSTPVYSYLERSSLELHEMLDDITAKLGSTTFTPL